MRHEHTRMWVGMGSRRRPLGVAGALWLGLFAVYMANGRQIGAYDTRSTVLVPVSVLRGDGVRLDRFRHLWPERLPVFVGESELGLFSRYPIGAALLAVPFTAPALALADRLEPDWERDPKRTRFWTDMLAKLSAAALTATTGALFYLLLHVLGFAAVALPATIITALGSNLWMIASQSLWQHGPAALALVTALLLLVPSRPTRLRLLLGGAAAVAIVWCRPQAAVLALLLGLGVAVRDGMRTALWCTPLAALLAAALLAYNVGYFGHVLGGYGVLFAMTSPAVHGVTSMFGENVVEGALGTLVSPSRGLFVFSPWVLLSLAALPATWPRLREWVVLRVALWGLPVFFLQLILHSAWWAGWSFGPRYWTEVMPLFGILLAAAFDWARERSRAFLAALALAGVAAIAVQAIGAFCYPSSFNARPGQIAFQQERLWSWRDGELARCLREGPRRPWR